MFFFLSGNVGSLMLQNLQGFFSPSPSLLWANVHIYSLICLLFALRVPVFIFAPWRCMELLPMDKHWRGGGAEGGGGRGGTWGGGVRLAVGPFFSVFGFIYMWGSSNLKIFADFLPPWPELAYFLLVFCLHKDETELPQTAELLRHDVKTFLPQNAFISAALPAEQLHTKQTRRKSPNDSNGSLASVWIFENKKTSLKKRLKI